MRTGNKLSIRTAYARLWGVFGYGNCYALPFFDWYYNYKCYRACKEEELSWDLENGCSIVVREREVRWYRVALSPAGDRAANSRRLRH